MCNSGGSEVKVSARNAGDLGSIPRSGRSPGEGNGHPLQCSCLENPRDGGAWWAAVYGVAQNRTRLKWLSSSSSRQGHRHGLDLQASTYFSISISLGPPLVLSNNHSKLLGIPWMYFHSSKLPLPEAERISSPFVCAYLSQHHPKEWAPLLM